MEAPALLDLPAFDEFREACASVGPILRIGDLFQSDGHIEERKAARFYRLRQLAHGQQIGVGFKRRLIGAKPVMFDARDRDGEIEFVFHLVHGFVPWRQGTDDDSAKPAYRILLQRLVEPSIDAAIAKLLASPDHAEEAVNLFIRVDLRIARFSHEVFALPLSEFEDRFPVHGQRLDVGVAESPMFGGQACDVRPNLLAKRAQLLFRDIQRIPRIVKRVPQKPGFLYGGFAEPEFREIFAFGIIVAASMAGIELFRQRAIVRLQYERGGVYLLREFELFRRLVKLAEQSQDREVGSVALVHFPQEFFGHHERPLRHQPAAISDQFVFIPYRHLKSP